MRFISFLKWLKWFFGFGPKQEEKVVEKVTPIFVPNEAYKVEHKKHYDARDVLIQKIENNKKKTIDIQSDDFDVRFKQLKRDVDKRYPYPIDTTPIEPKDTFLESMAIGYMTDSTVEGTLLGGDMLGAAIGDMLNSSDETPRFDEGFSGGDYSGGGAGADYSDNTPSYESPSYETPSYETPSSPSYDSPSYDPPSYDPPSYDDNSSSTNLDW